MASVTLKNITKSKEAYVSTMLNEKIKGNITYISSIAEEKTRTFRIEITLSNKDYICLLYTSPSPRD